MDSSHTTIRNWLDIYEQTFMVTVLQPFTSNVKKRSIKSPKVYLNDPGILHTLLNNEKAEASYYRTSNGSEVDLILQLKGKTTGFEFKISATPKITKNTINMANELNLDHLYIVTPRASPTQIAPNVSITNLAEIMT